METANTNGHAKKELTVEEMKAETKRLRVVNRYRQEKQANKQADLIESFYDWYSFAVYGGGSDLYQNAWSNQTQANPGIPPAQAYDRSGGRRWPIWVTDVQLNRFRMASRIIVATNSFASGLLTNLTNSVIGKGLTYKVAGKDTEEAQRFAGPPQEAEDDLPAPTPLDKLAAGVQTWLEGFMARNNWSPTGMPESISFDGDDLSTLAAGSTKEREAFWRTARDGDMILRLFRNQDGTVDVRFVDPTLVWGSPPGTTLEDGWSFGIQHKVEITVDEDGKEHRHHDRERVVAYYIRPKEPDENENSNIGGEVVAAIDIIHIKTPGEDAEVKHGTPVFSFDTLQALQRASNGQQITSLTAAVQASTAEYWKHMIGTKDQISSLQNPGARQSFPVQGNGQPVETFRPIPGQVRRGPASQEPIDLPQPHGPMFLEVWKGDLQQAGAAFSATESIISGDADTATYASMSEAGSLWVNAREADQEHFKTPFLKLMWRVIRWAVHCQRLPEQAMTLLDIAVEAPIVHKDNRAEMAQVTTAELAAKITSPQIEIGKRGNDPKKVAKDWKDWGKQTGEQQPPQGGEEMPPGQEQPPEGPKPPPFGGLQESRELLESKGNGRWITIGSSKGEDGKRKGGSRVYIEGGHITKGAPSLTGKKIAAMHEPAKEGSHRQQLNASKDYEKAKWAKKARLAGINGKALHQLAGEMKAHHDEFTKDTLSMLQDARKTAGKLGVPIHAKQLGEEHTKIPGFDELAREMAGRYPHILGAHGYSHNEGYDPDAEDASEKLHNLLRQGNPDMMSDDDAYEQALDALQSAKEEDEKLPAWVTESAEPAWLDLPDDLFRVRDVQEAQDASGHEHDSATGQFGSGSGEKSISSIIKDAKTYKDVVKNVKKPLREMQKKANKTVKDGVYADTKDKDIAYAAAHFASLAVDNIAKNAIYFGENKSGIIKGIEDELSPEKWGKTMKDIFDDMELGETEQDKKTKEIVSKHITPEFMRSMLIGSVQESMDVSDAEEDVEARRREYNQRIRDLLEMKDESGHEHAGKGEGGGQFVSGSGSGKGGKKSVAKKKPSQDESPKSQTGITKAIPADAQKDNWQEILGKFKGVDFKNITKDEWLTLTANPGIRSSSWVRTKEEYPGQNQKEKQNAWANNSLENQWQGALALAAEQLRKEGDKTVATSGDDAAIYDAWQRALKGKPAESTKVTSEEPSLAGDKHVSKKEEPHQEEELSLADMFDKLDPKKQQQAKKIIAKLANDEITLADYESLEIEESKDDTGREHDDATGQFGSGGGSKKKSVVSKISDVGKSASANHVSKQIEIGNAKFNFAARQVIPGNWAIGFSRDVKGGVTDKREKSSISEALGIFRNIQKIVDEVIDKNDPEELSFDTDSSDAGKVKLYDHLAKKLAAKKGFELSKSSLAGRTKWILRKAKQKDDLDALFGEKK